MAFNQGLKREAGRMASKVSTTFEGVARNEKDLKALLRQQYERSEYCDVTLKVNDGKVSAHWCILAGNSAYFKNMLPQDGSPGPEELDFSGKLASIDPVAAAVGFMYHGEIKIDKGEVQGILQIAWLFKMKPLEELSIEFLLKNLSLSTCLWTWAVGFNFSIDEVADIAKSVAVSRFHDTLIRTPRALKLKSNHLLHFLKQGLGKFCSKDKMHDFLQRWCKKDKPEREKYLQELKEAAKCPFGNPYIPCHENDPTTAPEDTEDPTTEARISTDLEEVFVHINTRKDTHIIYRPQKETWLTVRIPKMNEKFMPPFHGVGPSCRWVFFLGVDGFKLHNTFSKETFDVPPSTRGDAVWSVTHFTLNGDVYCIREETYVSKNEGAKTKSSKKNTAWDEGLRGVYFTGTKKMWKLCIDRLDVEKLKWKVFCESKALPGENYKKIRTTARKDGSGYIVCVREPLQLLIFHLTPDGKLHDLASPPPHVLSRECLDDVNYLEYIYILGTDDRLFIKLRNNALVYNIRENTWEVRKFPKERPGTMQKQDIMKTHYGREGDMYVFLQPCKSAFLQAGIYNPFKVQYTEIPPCPSFYMPTDVFTEYMKGSFLDTLTEASCEKSLMKESFVSQDWIRKTLKAVRRRWRRQEREAMADGKNPDDAEEMMVEGDEDDDAEGLGAEPWLSDIIRTEGAEPWLSDIMTTEWFQRSIMVPSLF